MSDDTKRSVRLCWGVPGLLRLTSGAEREDYFVTAGTEAGAYVLEKIDPTTGAYGPPYTVSAAGCTCPGFAHRKTCKHFSAVQALKAAGRL
jgi:hypothetical protein